MGLLEGLCLLCRLSVWPHKHIRCLASFQHILCFYFQGLPYVPGYSCYVYNLAQTGRCVVSRLCMQQIDGKQTSCLAQQRAAVASRESHLSSCSHSYCHHLIFSFLHTMQGFFSIQFYILHFAFQAVLLVFFLFRKVLNETGVLNLKAL